MNNSPHTQVYSDPTMYAGWPANHGAWQWGDEFLVGFLRGPYQSNSMHNIAQPFEKVLARSLDGGRTWTVDNPGVDFECKTTAEAPALDLAESIIRVCGVYDHGGDDCQLHGGFYVSHDRGKSWEGAYSFTGISFSKDDLCTARTCVVGQDVFLSECHDRQWGKDRIFVARHDGLKFNRMAELPADGGRMVMPSVVRRDALFTAVVRRRCVGERDGWIEAFGSTDSGGTWESLGTVGSTGRNNGNPPALVESHGRLYCCFANRTKGAINVALSEDFGITWSKPSAIRSGGLPDIGYPQLFVRTDGTPVCVYYWADKENPVQRIEATELTL